MKSYLRANKVEDSTQTNSSVGDFYEVYRAIKEARQAETSTDEQSVQLLTDISTLMDSVSTIDLAIEEQGAIENLIQSKQDLIIQISELNFDYDNLNSAYVRPSKFSARKWEYNSSC